MSNNNWKVQHFNNEKIDCKISRETLHGDLVVEGNIKSMGVKTFNYIAPNPPTFMMVLEQHILIQILRLIKHLM